MYPLKQAILSSTSLSVIVAKVNLFTPAMMKRINLKKWTISLIFAMVCFIMICHLVILRNKNALEIEKLRQFPADKEWARLAMEMRIKKHSSSRECIHPNLSLGAPEIMKYMHDVLPLNCSLAEPDWVVCKNTECRVKNEIKAMSRAIKCSFTDIYSFTDDLIKRGHPDVALSYNLERSDVVDVNCRFPKRKWSSILTGVRLNRIAWKRADWIHVPSNGLKLNVLMFGVSSMSRNTFIRKLPKTYFYLTQILNGLVLEGYNVVGDGSVSALTPILTGKTETELPDARKRFKNTSYVDSYPFVWNDFRNSGYVTAYYEDLVYNGTYQERLRGFKQPPTDHYMRPYYLAVAEFEKNNHWADSCVGSVPRHKIMMNHILDFFSVYNTKPKFLFGFLRQLSERDCNSVGVIDNDFVEFLKNLQDNGVLENTILILMSDHGRRFGPIRETIQGKQEERLPFFSFRFPTWFKSYYKNLYKNFLVNTKRLTTPFDVYATLKNVLNLTAKDQLNRSISLFDMIPLERSCADAHIEPHWCACVDWHAVDLRTAIVETLTHKLIDTINNYTSGYRQLCSKLEISKVIWVFKLKPDESLVKFRKSADVDSYHPELSAKVSVEKETYQIRLLLSPGHGLFETSIEHYLADHEVVIRMSDIRRINKYGYYARCVERNLPHLANYCYCV